MQQLGLIVTIRDAFTRDAKRIQREMDKLGTSALRSGKRITEAFRGPVSFTPLRNALLGVSFAMFALNKTVGTMTGAFNEQAQALVRLDQATLRWGRNAVQVNAEVNRLVTSGALNQARAATAVTNLLQGRFNEAQIRAFNRGLQDIVASGLSPGQNFDEVFLRVTEGIKTGNLGQLEALGVPNIAQRFRLLGGDPSDLIDPFRQEIGRGILFTILEQEFSRTEGRFEEFITSLRGQTLVLQNTLTNTRIAIGRALEPVVLAFTKRMILLVKSIQTFVQENPAFIKALLVVAVTIPIILLGLAALKVALIAAGAAFFGATAPLLVIVAGFIALGLFLRRNRNPFRQFGMKALIGQLKGAVFFIQAVVQALFSLKDGTITINEALAIELENRGLLPALRKTITTLIDVKNAAIAFALGVFEGLQPVIFVFGAIAKAVFKVTAALFGFLVSEEDFTKKTNIARTAGILFAIVLSGLLLKATLGLSLSLLRLAPLIFAIAIPFLKVLVIVEAVNAAINAIVIGMKGLVGVARIAFAILPGGETVGQAVTRSAAFIEGGAFNLSGDVSEGFGLLRRSPTLAAVRAAEEGTGVAGFVEGVTEGGILGTAGLREGATSLAEDLAAALRATPMIFNGTIMLDGREIGFSVDEQNELNQTLEGIPPGG